MKWQRHIGILVTAGLLCCVAIGFSAAFVNRSMTIKNVITFGSVDLQLNETYMNEEGKELPFDTCKVTNLTSSAVQNRIFRAENKGKHSLYVRVSFSISGIDKEGKVFDVQEYFRVESELEGWIYKDGWFYYDSVLQPGEKTDTLVADMIFDMEQLTNYYPGSKFEVSVKAQGVQSEHNQQDSILLVEGWPEL